ncbi:MAG TPA: dihydrodipicolinate synthase family protein [Pseudonocardiaceae bacterium]
MTQEPLWRGIGVALVTFFDEDAGVAYEETAAHAARLVEAGVRAVLVAGTTGEADALDDSERVKLVEAVRAAVDVPVIAGASGAWVGQATERVRAVVAAGADAVLVAPPRRCTDPRPFYEKVAEAAGSVPVLAYHFPGVAGGEVPVELLPDLPVAGLKDSSGDVERLLRELSVWEGWTYVGSSALTASAGLLGATGALLAVANAVPELAVAAFGSPAPPDGEAQRALLSVHLRSRSAFPRGLKELVAEHFGTPVHSRMS